MAEHPNATLIRQAIEAFNQGNPGALTALIADDAVFTVPGWIFSVRDGRIIEGRNLQENQDAIDAFWSAGEFMATMTSDNAA